MTVKHTGPNFAVRLILLFSVVFSLLVLTGPMSSDFHLPAVQLASATIIGPGSPYCQTTGSSGACAEYWYPAGPSMGTFLGTIFTNENTEYSTGLLAGTPTIDYTDWPVPAGVSIAPGSQLGGAGYLVTAQIPALGYYEIQFMLAATLFGCNFQHGNSACGVNIRQGIAHMIDKPVFAATDPGIPTGAGVPIDNPVPTSSAGGLLSPYSCNYDNRNIAGWHNQTNAALCSVGAGVGGNNIGGGSYHFASAAGADGFSWLQAPGSADLNEAAAHFVMAGIASGCLNGVGTGVASCLTSTTSILTGVSAQSCSTPSCSFFVRNDNPPRLDLGNGLAAEICYILTGTYGTPGCTPLTVTDGPITAFPGFTTSTISEALTWGMYTAAYQGPTFYDGSFFFTYNSAFVSGIGSNQVSGGGPCSNAAVPTQAASNYMYLCNSNYDTFSTQLETSPCLIADRGGDPVAGAFSNLPTGPGNGQCTNGVLSSRSAGVQAEAYFGQNVFTLPVFETKDQYGYLQCQPPGPCTVGNSWIRASNNAGVGLPTYFTWLNSWNQNPAISGTIRQGFKETTRSVSPYIASTVWDTYITGNVYDTLYAQNPLNTAQFFNWMTENTQRLTSVSYTSGGVTSAPPGSAVTYRFTLRPDLTFHDSRPVTSYDVAFSYLSEVGNGAFLATPASVMTGITILSPMVFDIGVSSTGPFVLPNLTGVPIVSARYWTNAGPSAWDNAVRGCATSPCLDSQYTLSGSTVVCTGACSRFPASLMTISPIDLSASFDPIEQHTLIGSGPWQCGIATGFGSGFCTPIGIGNGASSYTLTAFPNYFRSSQRLAIYLWSGESDTNAIGPATAVGSCFNVAVNLAGPCGHYQQGAGNPGSGTPVSVATVGNVDIFFNLNWLAPFEWTTSPPAGIAPLPPLLYGPGTTFRPNPGGSSCTTPNNYYDC